VRNAISLDLGPTFIASVAQEAGERVCILTPKAATDTRIQARVREVMKSQGIDCRICGGCPMGQAE
jgi:hypothetical protein